MNYLTNKCKTNDFLTLAEISEFATDIKNRTSHDIDRLKVSIKENGFLFPLFIWKGRNVILDGKARFLALKQLKEDGFLLDKIPVVFVEAKDEQEAKEKVLQVNSRYGKITEGSLNFFAKDCKIDLSDLNIHLDKINFSFESKEDLVKRGTAIVGGVSASQVVPNTPQCGDSSLQIGGSVVHQPAEDFLKGNDGTLEQSWADSMPNIEMPQFEGAIESSPETAESSPFEPFESEIIENPQDGSSQSAPVQSTEASNKVPFTCPFCYSQFELTIEEIKEILAQ